MGLEPTRCRHRQILSLVRLPIPPLLHRLRSCLAGILHVEPAPTKSIYNRARLLMGRATPCLVSHITHYTTYKTVLQWKLKTCHRRATSPYIFYIIVLLSLYNLPERSFRTYAYNKIQNCIEILRRCLKTTGSPEFF